jgi:hypothetical protein
MKQEARMIHLDDIKQMLAEADEQTLTLYLNVDNAREENQSQQPAWRIWLKDVLRQQGNQHREGGSKETWNQIYQRVKDFFEDYRPSTTTLALFTGPDFQRAVELPLAFENQMYYGKPAITPLLWALDEHEAYLIALVDQEKARLFIAQLGAVGFEESLETDLDDYDQQEHTTLRGLGPGITNAAVYGGTGKDDFKDMIGEQINHFFRDTVEHMQKLVDKHGIRRIILGGGEESAHAVENFMPETLRQQVVGIVPIPMRATTQQIGELAGERALAYERAKELDLVNQVIDFAKSGGRGALGAKAVLEALDMQRVELLIMPWPMDDQKLAAELPLRAFASGGSVELVHDQAAERLKQEGGLAARLYYAL